MKTQQESTEPSVSTRLKALFTPKSLSPRGWPGGFIAAVVISSLTVLFLIVSIPLNSAGERAQIKRFAKQTPDFVRKSFDKVRCIRFGKGLDVSIRASISELGRLWNKPFQKRLGVTPRFVFYQKGMKDCAIVDVVDYKGPKCQRDDIHFADLDEGTGDATFKLRLCVEKAYIVARAVKKIVGTGKDHFTTQYWVQKWYKESPQKMWGCILGHELGHTYIHAGSSSEHPFGEGLMKKGGGACVNNDQTWSIIKAVVLPHIPKSARYSDSSVIATPFRLRR